MYKAPIKIKIQNYQSQIKIGEFYIRKIIKKEQLRFFWITEIILNENWYMSSCAWNINLSESRSLFWELECYKYVTCEYIILCNNSDYITTNINNLLMAFRLYKQWTIFAPIAFKDPIWLIAQAPYFPKETGQYIVNKSDIYKIRQIYNNIINKYQDKKFKLVKERFNNAISKQTNIWNSFIDMIWIIETLFISNDREIKFRFSLYIWYLLKNILKVETSFKELSEIYSLRSSIAHWTNRLGITEKYKKLYWFVIELLKYYLNHPDQKIEDLVLKKLKI